MYVRRVREIRLLLVGFVVVKVCENHQVVYFSVSGSFSGLPFWRLTAVCECLELVGIVLVDVFSACFESECV